MTIIINPNELDDKKNVRKGQPVRPNRSVKVNYRNALYDITRMLGQNTQEITSLLASGAPAVQVMDQLNDAIARSQARAEACLLYTSPSPRDRQKSRMPSSA